MTDILESAKEQLHNNNFSIVIVGENDVYTSTHALDVFEKYKVKTYYGNLVEYIINRDKTGMCPMEKAVLEVDEPNTAYDVLKKKIAEMRKGGH